MSVLVPKMSEKMGLIDVSPRCPKYGVTITHIPWPISRIVGEHPSRASAEPHQFAYMIVENVRTRAQYLMKISQDWYGRRTGRIICWSTSNAKEPCDCDCDA